MCTLYKGTTTSENKVLFFVFCFESKIAFLSFDCLNVSVWDGIGWDGSSLFFHVFLFFALCLRLLKSMVYANHVLVVWIWRTNYILALFHFYSSRIDDATKCPPDDPHLVHIQCLFFVMFSGYPRMRVHCPWPKGSDWQHKQGIWRWLPSPLISRK